jgi:hypothetical protein
MDRMPVFCRTRLLPVKECMQLYYPGDLIFKLNLIREQRNLKLAPCFIGLRKKNKSEIEYIIEGFRSCLFSHLFLL